MSAAPDRARGSVLVAVLVVVAGGLLLAGGAAGEWVVNTEVRDVGGVEVTEETAAGGLEFAPGAIGVGILTALGAVVLAVVRGRARQAVAAAIVGAGLVGVALVGVGISDAVGRPGDLGPAQGLGVAGGLLVAAGGGLALRRARAPVLAKRYSLEGAGAVEDEWGLASADSDDPPR